MYARTVKYTDYLDNEREETFYFHLTKAEVIEWMTATPGAYTLDKLLEKLLNETNMREIIKIFKDLVYRAYGEKSLDGRRFIKTDEVKQNFMESEAYSIIFTDIISDATKSAEFVNGILPKDLTQEIATIVAQNPDGVPDSLREYATQVTTNV